MIPRFNPLPVANKQQGVRRTRDPGRLKIFSRIFISPRRTPLFFLVIVMAKTYGLASYYAERVERHESDSRLMRALKLKKIEEEELKARCSLSSPAYNRAGLDKRRSLRSKALSLSLKRWI